MYQNKITYYRKLYHKYMIPSVCSDRVLIDAPRNIDIDLLVRCDSFGLYSVLNQTELAVVNDCEIVPLCMHRSHREGLIEVSL